MELLLFGYIGRFALDFDRKIYTFGRTNTSKPSAAGKGNFPAC